MSSELNTALFIRDYLEEYGETNPYEVYQAYRETIEQDPYINRKASYQNIRNYFYWLHKLGLIKRTKTEPSTRKSFKRKQFYRLVDDKKNDDAWNDPRKALYGKRKPSEE